MLRMDTIRRARFNVRYTFLIAVTAQLRSRLCGGGGGNVEFKSKVD